MRKEGNGFGDGRVRWVWREEVRFKHIDRERYKPNIFEQIPIDGKSRPWFRKPGSTYIVHHPVGMNGTNMSDMNHGVVFVPKHSYVVDIK